MVKYWVNLEEDEINLLIDALKAIVEKMERTTDKPEVDYKYIWSDTIKLLDKLGKVRKKSG